MTRRNAARLSTLVAALALSWPATSVAHSGRTDSEGCHGGSKRYHCHGADQPVRQFFRPAAIERDRDCKDFPTQAAAQSFFVRAGTGDPHRLDRDKDGVACERLP